MSALRGLRAALGDVPRQVGYVSGPALMSTLRRWWVLLRHRHAHVRFLGPVYLGPGFSLHIPDGGTFVVGPGVEFRRGFRAEVLGDGRVTIGPGTVFTYYVVLQCSTSIDIGSNCTFAQAATVIDGQHRFRDLDRPMSEQGFDFTPIRIQNDAAIMAKATVMADVERRAFVGAGAVVTQPAPAYCVSVGVPARPVDYFGPAGGAPPDLAAGR
jgi:acetyltransferase-like isoleucine patch superfamily enzyme